MLGNGGWPPVQGLMMCRSKPWGLPWLAPCHPGPGSASLDRLCTFLRKLSCISHMITVGTFTTPEEAHLLRSQLESAGIPAYLHSEYAVQNEWIGSNLIGGVRVQISELDLDIAREFFASEMIDPPEEAEPVPCPACGSGSTGPDPLPRHVGIFSLLVLHIPWPFIRRRWRCTACGQRFKLEKSS